MTTPLLVRLLRCGRCFNERWSLSEACSHCGEWPRVEVLETREVVTVPEGHRAPVVKLIGKQEVSDDRS